MSSTLTPEFDAAARNKLVQAAAQARGETDALLRSLAAEIAMGINDFDVILANHGLTQDTWDKIKRHARFNMYLTEAAVQWGATTNAAARIKAKAEAMVEAALPTLYEHLVKGDELTPSKVKLVEALMKGAGVGVDNSRGSGEGVSIVINMDAAVPAKPTITIDHEANDM